MEKWPSTPKTSVGESASIDVIIFAIRPPEVEKMRILRLATGLSTGPSTREFLTTVHLY